MVRELAPLFPQVYATSFVEQVVLYELRKR